MCDACRVDRSSHYAISGFNGRTPPFLEEEGKDDAMDQSIPVRLVDTNYEGTFAGEN